MKNLHGYAREVAINEMLDKSALLNEIARSRGLEDDLTIKLYAMAERGESYKAMVIAKKAYEGAEELDA